MVTHGHFEIALGLFVVAGITDLVSTPYLGGWKYWQGFEPGTYALLATSDNQADNQDNEAQNTTIILILLSHKYLSLVYDSLY